MDLWEIHPALVHFPIAFLIAGVLVDLFDHNGSGTRAWLASGLLWAGVATGAVAAAAGALAFFTVPSTHTEWAHETVLWHLGSAVTMFVLFLIVALLRWQHGPSTPSVAVRGLGVIAAIILIAAAYLGGQIVYHGGMGVDSSILSSKLQKHEHQDTHSQQATSGSEHEHAEK